MLVLTRECHDEITITHCGEVLRLKVVEIRGHGRPKKCRLSFDAPRSFRVWRSELLGPDGELPQGDADTVWGPMPLHQGEETCHEERPPANVAETPSVAAASVSTESGAAVQDSLSLR